MNTIRQAGERRISLLDYRCVSLRLLPLQIANLDSCFSLLFSLFYNLFFSLYSRWMRRIRRGGGGRPRVSGVQPVVSPPPSLFLPLYTIGEFAVDPHCGCLSLNPRGGHMRSAPAFRNPRSSPLVDAWSD